MRLAVIGGDKGHGLTTLGFMRRQNEWIMSWLNAGAALWVAGAARDPAEGARLAEVTIDSGKAAAALQRLVDVSRRHAGLA